jgi:hypothetical protein
MISPTVKKPITSAVVTPTKAHSLVLRFRARPIRFCGENFKFLIVAGLRKALIRGWKYDWKVTRFLIHCQGSKEEDRRLIVVKDLRRSHLLAVKDNLSEFETDTGVVNGRRDHA